MVAAGQHLAQDFPVLGFSGPAVLGRPDAERPDDVVIKVADGQGRHGALSLRMLSMHTHS